MKAYPKYKDSGTAWQGKVPAHWEKFRNKNELIPKVNHIGDNPNKLPMLSLTKKGIIVRDLDSGKGKFSADESKFLIVEPGDFVFCHYDIQETPRTVGLSTHLGYITGSYNIYGYKGTNSRFFYYLHEYFDDGKLLCPLYRGLRNTIRQDRFLSMQIFLPPADEQAAIVSYLDKKCAEIDDLVSRRLSIIERLRELKQSIIAEAVTKGLSPKVPMKDSGTAWQGKVPAHWDKFRNKNELIPKVNHIGDNPNKLPMLSLTKKGIIVRDLDSGKGKFSADESKFLIVEPGDFVFCHYDIQETPRTVGLSTHLGYITGSYNVYGYKGTSSRFFYYLHEYFDDGKLLCPLYRGLRNTIRQDRFLSMQIFLPPADEQAAIVSYLEKKCAEIDELVARQEQIIEKLKELKTTTIAHVVTGKVDVRENI